MKKLRIISFLLASVLVLPYSTAFAEKGQLSDFREDDVFRFDLNEDFFDFNVDEEEEKFLLNNAEEKALALGLMQKESDGNFRSDELLKYNEYVYALKMLLGTGTELEVLEETVSVEEAASGILAILGYEDYVKYQNKDNWTAALELGLVKSDVNPGKKITRREFAEMLEITYEIPMYKKSIDSDLSVSMGEGETILEENGIEKIKGFVNGVPGINVFSSTRPEEGIIEIERVKYCTGIESLSGYLGVYADGYAKFNEDTEEWELLYIKANSKDSRVYGSLRDIDTFSENEILYKNEDGIKRVKIGELKNIVLNGDHIKDITPIIEMLPEEQDGYFMLSKSDGNTYDTLVVWKYDSFVINSVDKNNKKIHLKYGAQLGGNGYIELPEEDAFWEITEYGKKIKLENLGAGVNISVVQSSDKMYTTMKVSNVRTEGKIVGINENKIKIDDKEYYVSQSYINSPESEAFKIGDEGTFYLNDFGVICGYDKSKSTDIFYAYLRRIAVDTDSEDDKILIDVFDESGEWNKYYLADKVKLDGTNVSGENKITQFANKADIYQNTMLRIKTNDSNEVTMIDTITDSEAEKDDKKRLELKAQNINSCLYFGGGVFIHNTNYKFKKSAKIFYLPEDREDRDEFKILQVSNFETENSNVKYTFDLYTADEFYFCDLVICHDFVRKDENYFYITNVTTGINEDDMAECVLEGYSFSYTSSGEKIYKIEDDVLEQIKTSGYALEKDRLIALQATSGYVENVTSSIDCRSDEFLLNPTSKQSGYLCGRITRINVAEKIIMVQYEDENGNSAEVSLIHLVNAPKKITNRHKIETIEIADINPGDRVLIQFGWGYFYSLLVLE